MISGGNAKPVANTARSTQPDPASPGEHTELRDGIQREPDRAGDEHRQADTVHATQGARSGRATAPHRCLLTDCHQRRGPVRERAEHADDEKGEGQPGEHTRSLRKAGRLRSTVAGERLPLPFDWRSTGDERRVPAGERDAAAARNPGPRCYPTVGVAPAPPRVSVSDPLPFLTRFAPAPTGYLHIGHVVSALYVWEAARAAGGRVIVRIEDHDRQRSRPEYSEALLQDLAWLGFEPDGPVVRQSERDPVYRERSRAWSPPASSTAARARARPAARRAGARRRAALPGDLSGPRPAPSRERGVARADGPGVGRFVGGRLGAQAQEPAAQCGDLLVRDRLGNWTYQFAAVADDTAQGITDVIRGEDLLASTGRQIRLARLLGRTEPPRFLHHPLVMASASEKLSSRTARPACAPCGRPAGRPLTSWRGRGKRGLPHCRQSETNQRTDCL